MQIGTIIHQFLKAALLLVAVTATLQAQSAQSPVEDDPVKRAMERIQATVDERAAAAERVLAASILIAESAEARKRGRTQQADESLVKAEKIVAEAGAVERSALIAELLRRVAGERATLNPKPTEVTPLPTNWTLTGVIPKPALTRYHEYRERLGRVLSEENVPLELLSVALIESGFNPFALSPKGARGIWQFMPATAARYGLSVGPAEDHRIHPEHSTRAAARYLRDLYRQFGDWKLALAAYNAGEARVQRIIDRSRSRDFEELSQRGLLPLETRKYVPAVLAVWARLSRISVTSR